MTVDVELDDGGAVTAIRPVTDSDLAQEQAKQAVNAAGEKGKQLLSFAVVRVGKPALIAVALLIVSCFFLNYCSVKATSTVFSVETHITFWQGMGALNIVGDDLDNLPQLMADLSKYSDKHGEKPSAGIYGFICILALAAPLLPLVWKDKRAVLGALLPLIFTLGVTLQYLHYTHSIEQSVRTAITKAYSSLATGNLEGLMGTGSASQPTDPRLSAQIQAQVNMEIEQAKKSEKFSLDLGFYLSSLAALYLAGDGLKRYLVLKASAA
jgi:hypothetical protein